MDSVEQHLAICETCAERSHELQPRDELVELVTAASSYGDSCYALTAHQTVKRLPNYETQTVSDLASATSLTHTDEEVPPTPQLPDQSRYRIIDFLGSGGMGQVWLAEHLVLGRRVALKMLRMNFLRKGNATDRFDREMKAAAKLDHPNIARVHDAEQLGDLHFLVMEYVEGETLAEIVSRGPLPIADACRVIRDAACGLAHAHKARLIHRDIKPGNMIRTPAGVVKLLDFGLVVSPEDAISLTGPNLVMGTPDYISPEQAEDPHAADERSDIYSLGCTLYHLLSGHVPFPVTSTVRKIDAHRSGELNPIPSIPGTLMAIVSRMMARNPADRFQTAAEVVVAMESFLTPDATALTDPMRAETRPESQNDGPGLPMGIGKRWLVFACTSIVIFTLFAIRFANNYGKLDTQEVAVQNKPPITRKLWLRKETQTKAVEVLSGAANQSQGVGLVGEQRIASAENRLAQTDFKHRLVGHTALVRYTVFSADSQQLFTCSDDGTVCVWDVASGILVGKLDHRESNENPVRVKGLALADSGATLLTSQDDRVRLWDIASRTEILGAFDSVSPDQLQNISSNSEGTQVVAGSVSGNIRVWDISSRKLICESPALSTDSNYSAVWIPGRPELLVADGEYLEILDVPSGKRRVLFTNADRYCNAAVSVDGSKLAGVCFSTEVTLLDGRTYECESEFWSNANRVQFLPDGRFVTASVNRNLDIWVPNGRTRLATFLCGMSEAAPLAVSPDGRFIASAGDDNSILIWDVPDTPLLNN